MYSNDPTSAKAAMCFHLDPHCLPPWLSFSFLRCSTISAPTTSTAATQRGFQGVNTCASGNQFNANMVALIGGVGRVIVEGSYSELMVQLFLTLLITISSYPIIEGFAIRRDAGRVPPSVTFFSIICTMVLLSLGLIVSQCDYEEMETKQIPLSTRSKSNAHLGP
ncbi:cellulose synthase A catalytic subunit 7 UDP-forming [Cinnamomum micranthum f. kanehirae]|uniref:Cellulose synthase A catalytic subunit 7 UDP-forming n=1 Tax=Cinnamomum micranthum f. kanehirae TaxID=337451 RepID=A0A3S3N5D6_9MAGN|nr:cellulose synthase A catalytic subunit 7 UDP-forming [Cinnamomum micranthum f. kanehirae]